MEICHVGSFFDNLDTGKHPKGSTVLSSPGLQERTVPVTPSSCQPYVVSQPNTVKSSETSLSGKHPSCKTNQQENMIQQTENEDCHQQEHLQLPSPENNSDQTEICHRVFWRKEDETAVFEFFATHLTQDLPPPGKKLCSKFLSQNPHITGNWTRIKNKIHNEQKRRRDYLQKNKNYQCEK
ncbi:uncharacterized protein LOC144444135 [Glandiceps talaboti]